ncbi:MAG: hypothetical protein ABIH17_07890, partial [Pseudomonadota bacterium]
KARDGEGKSGSKHKSAFHMVISFGTGPHRPLYKGATPTASEQDCLYNAPINHGFAVNNRDRP